MPPAIKNVTLKRFLKTLKDRTPKGRFLWAMLSFFIGRSAYHQLGWFKSAWRANAIDAAGEPIPWITYSAIDFLEKKCSKQAKLKVWEFGSGNSTLWWAKRAASLTAVEHNKDWYEHVKKQLMPYKHASILFSELGDGYPGSVLKTKQKYDVIVVDGRMRVACADAASRTLKDSGVIVWDNSERTKYQPGVKRLEKAGFKRIDFVGPVPIGNYLGQTSVFYKADNILGI